MLTKKLKNKNHKNVTKPYYKKPAPQKPGKKFTPRNVNNKQSKNQKYRTKAVKVQPVVLKKRRPVPFVTGLRSSARRISALIKWLRSALVSRSRSGTLRSRLRDNAPTLTKSFFLHCRAKMSSVRQLEKHSKKRVKARLKKHLKIFDAKFSSVHFVGKTAARRRLQFIRATSNPTRFKKPRAFSFKSAAAAVYSPRLTKTKSSSNSIKSFNNFLETYKVQTAKRVTAQWKANLNTKFRLWVRRNVSFYPAKRFYNENAVHRAKTLLFQRLSREEMRTRVFQKKYQNWALLWPAFSNLERKTVRAIFAKLYGQLRQIIALRRRVRKKRLFRVTRQQYRAALVNIVRPRLPVYRVRHFSKSKRARYRFSRFLTGFIFKFLSFDYVGKRRAAFKKYIQEKRKATKKDAIAYVTKKKWTSFDVSSYTKKKQLRYLKKRNLQTLFFKKSPVTETKKYYYPQLSYRQRGVKLRWYRKMRRSQRHARRAMRWNRKLVVTKRRARANHVKPVSPKVLLVGKLPSNKTNSNLFRAFSPASLLLKPKAFAVRYFCSSKNLAVRFFSNKDYSPTKFHGLALSHQMLQPQMLSVKTRVNKNRRLLKIKGGKNKKSYVRDIFFHFLLFKKWKKWRGFTHSALRKTQKRLLKNLRRVSKVKIFRSKKKPNSAALRPKPAKDYKTSRELFLKWSKRRSKRLIRKKIVKFRRHPRLKYLVRKVRRRSKAVRHIIAGRRFKKLRQLSLVGKRYRAVLNWWRPRKERAKLKRRRKFIFYKFKETPQKVLRKWARIEKKFRVRLGRKKLKTLGIRSFVSKHKRRRLRRIKNRLQVRRWNFLLKKLFLRAKLSRKLSSFTIIRKAYARFFQKRRNLRLRGKRNKLSVNLSHGHSYPETESTPYMDPLSIEPLTYSVPWKKESKNKVRWKKLAYWHYVVGIARNRNFLPIYRLLKQRRLTAAKQRASHKKNVYRKLQVNAIHAYKQKYGRVVRRLRAFSRRVKQRRLSRRRFVSKSPWAKFLPAMASTQTILNRYERDRRRGKIFSRRKKRKFSKLKYTPQWVANMANYNRNIAKRFSGLRRIQQGLRSFCYIPSKALALLSGTEILKFSVGRSRDTFPFRHKKNPNRARFSSKKYTNSWLLQAFKRLPLSARKKLTKTFYRLAPKVKSKAYLAKNYNRKRSRRLRKVPSLRPYTNALKRRKNVKYLRTATDRTLLLKRRGRRQFRYSVRSRTWKNRGIRRRAHWVAVRLRRKRWEKWRPTVLHLRLKKMRGTRRFTKTYFAKPRPTGWTRKAKGVTAVQKFRRAATKILTTFSSTFQQNIRRRYSKKLSSLPYYNILYRMRGRLRSKTSRVRPTKDTFPKFKIFNKNRYIRARKLYLKRETKNITWNSLNAPFNLPAVVRREERYKRDFYKQRWYDSNNFRTRAHTGSPTAAGHHRTRRTFISAFSTNRWWKPTPVRVPELKTALPRFSLYSNKLGTLSLKGQKNSFSLKLRSNQNDSLKFGFFDKFLSENYVSITQNSLSWANLPTAFTLKFSNLNNKVYADAERKNEKLKSAWQFYKNFYSLEIAKKVRTIFLLTSSASALTLPNYKQISKWPVKVWEQFKNFLNDYSSITTQEFRYTFLKKLHNEMFELNKSTYTEELVSQLGDLEKELLALWAPKQLFINLQLQKLARNTLQNNYVPGFQEKKLLTFTALHLPEKEQRDYILTAFTTQETNLSTLENPTQASAYNTWAATLQQHLKLVRPVVSVLDMDEEQDDGILALGINYPRLPATARRRHTFDAFLRGRFRKITPQKFRRLMGKRFKRPCLKLFPHFTSRIAKTESTRAGRFSRLQLTNIQSSRFLSKHSRELFIRKTKSTNKSVFLKRRFASLPITLKSKLDVRRNLKAKSHLQPKYTGNAEFMMQTALRKHFVTRQIRDLRKAVRRRRFSWRRSPFWKRYKLARRARKMGSFKHYDIALANRHKRATSFHWTLSEFAIQVPKNVRRRASYLTVAGELLLSKNTLNRRKKFRKLKLVKMKKRNRKWKLGFKVATRLRHKPHPKKRYKKRRRKAFRILLRRKMQKKYNYRISTRLAAHRSIRVRLEKFALANKRLNYQLVNQTRPSMVLTPLHFRKPSTFISVSASEKKRWKLFVQASRQRRYRRLTEFSEKLTTYFPQLISYLVEKRVKTNKLTKKQVAGLVQSIYWNLRMYLHADFTGEKIETKYALSKQLQRLRREVASAAEYRHFTLMDLRAARYRFQPHRLHRAPSLVRGSKLWLRRFLPRFYELYLEDPEKYKHLKLTPIKVFRSQINRGSVKKWETKKVPGRMEDRFIRLTTERKLKNSSRFENMLMTTRRAPLISGYGTAAALHVINPVGISSVRTSFFRRSFSTKPEGLKITSLTKTGLILSRINLADRQTTSETSGMSAQLRVSTHRAVKERLVGGARPQEVRHAAVNSGSLDIRSVRSKSARNAEYLQRLPLHRTNKRINSKKPSLKPIHRQAVGAMVRKSFAKVQAPSNYMRKIANSVAMLPIVRAKKITRRFAAALPHVQKSLHSKIRHRRFRRNFIFSNRIKAQTLRSVIRVIKKNVVTKYSAPNIRVPGNRSILHYRKAESRSVFLYSTKAPVLLNRALQLKELTYRTLKAKQFENRLVYRLNRQRTFDHAILHRETLRRYRAAPVNPKKWKTKLWLNKVASAENRSIIAYRTALQKRFVFEKNKFTRPLLIKNDTVRLKTNFFSHSKKIRRNAKNISKAVNADELRRSVMHFTRRRKRLWGHLTLRWMKKKRLLKGWLKLVKYSFKDKSWIAAVNHVMKQSGGKARADSLFSETLFKASRLRLRRLEWRERSDRFSRLGFRNAFTFHPRERKNAPWLESLMFTRSAYNFQRGEYKRDQFPREQKYKKWLQRIRKSLYRKKASHVYIRGRKWPLLRMYNQRLHISLFHLRNTKVALKRFRKLSRRKTKNSGFEKSMVGFGDRLDVNLLLLNIAPTVFWARRMTRLGLLRVNGSIARDTTFRFKTGDYVEWVWDKIQRFQTYFVNRLKKPGYSAYFKNTSFDLPGNFAYHPKLRSAHYTRLPKLSDLPEAARLNPRLFRWFQLDSGLNK